MSVREILVYPNQLLREKTSTIDCIDGATKALIDDLFETMYDDQGCGLAATQVGASQRLFVMDASRDQTNPICMINPEIINREGVVQSDEGCLSFPGVYVQVKRAKIITVRYKNESFEEQESTLEGLAAHCVQHELDHLNGELFIDLLSKLKRDRVLKKLAKLQRA